MNRPPIQKPSAVSALERALMEQQEIRDSQVEETANETEEESKTDPEFAARIAERQAERQAQRDLLKQAQTATREEAAQFTKENTKVGIADVGFERRPKAIETAARPIPTGNRDKLVEQRTKQWTTYLVEDFNPLLVKATSTFVGIPDESWLTSVVLSAIKPGVNGAPDQAINFWEPPLKTRLELSQKKARTLAKAAAEFSVSPMGVAVVTWVETHQFMIAVGAAMMVAAQYGWTLMQTKAEIAQVKSIIEDQMKAQMQMQMQAQQNGEGRLPGFQEKTNESNA
jgi:hypothetical protein